MGPVFEKQIITDEIARSPEFLRQRLKRSLRVASAMAVGTSIAQFMRGKPSLLALGTGLAVFVFLLIVDGGLEWLIWSSRVRKWRNSLPAEARPGGDDPRP